MDVESPFNRPQQQQQAPGYINNAPAAGSGTRKTRTSLLALRIVQIILLVGCLVVSSIFLNEVVRVHRTFNMLLSEPSYVSDVLGNTPASSSQTLTASVKDRELHSWRYDGSVNVDAVGKSIVGALVSLGAMSAACPVLLPIIDWASDIGSN
eukprot:gene5521-5756_t